MTRLNSFVPIVVYLQPYGDDAVVFDELLHELSITIDKFKTLYDSRKAMIDLLLSYEHGSAERDEARITLRKMTGELKNIAEEINMITYQMSLLRDKKHEAKQEAKAEEAT